LEQSWNDEVPVRRYFFPALLLAMAALIAAGENRVDSLFGMSPALVAMCVYVVASIWWVVGAASADRPFPPHLLAAWVPAIPPVVVAWLAMRATDAAAMGILAALPVIVAPLLGALVATFVLLLRMSWPPAGE